MLQNDKGLLVHELAEALTIFEVVQLWGINGALESSKRLKNCQELSGRVSYLYLRMLVGKDLPSFRRR